LPIYDRLHVGQEYVVEVHAEKVHWDRSQVDARWWIQEEARSFDVSVGNHGKWVFPEQLLIDFPRSSQVKSGR
jgi:hypothetical protein